MILLSRGIIFMLFMVLSITTYQYFMQDLIFVGILYAPFYILLFLVVNFGMAVHSRVQIADST